MEAEEEGMAAKAEVAQAAAGKGEAGIAVAEQGLPLVAVLTRTQWILITRAPLAGRSPTLCFVFSPLGCSQDANFAWLAVCQCHSIHRAASIGCQHTSCTLQT